MQVERGAWSVECGGAVGKNVQYGVQDATFVLCYSILQCSAVRNGHTGSEDRSRIGHGSNIYILSGVQ